MNPLGNSKSVEIKNTIKKIAALNNLPVNVVEKIIESQTSLLVNSIKEGKNVRLLRLTMFYNRLNKNPEYLKMKENERNDSRTT